MIKHDFLFFKKKIFFTVKLLFFFTTNGTVEHTGKMLVFLKKRLYFLVPCILFGLLVPSLSARAPFHPFEFSNRLRFNLGLGPAFNYFNLGSSSLGPLQIALEENGVIDTLEASQVIEEQGRIALPAGQTPPQSVGGCPDATYFLAERVALSSPTAGAPDVVVNPQLVELDGIECGADNSYGGGSYLNTVELDFNLEYDIFPWLFLRTGFAGGFVLPKKYGFDLSYRANGRLTEVQGIPESFGGNVPIELASDTTTTFTVSAYQLRVPLLIGFNLLQFKYASFYTGFGIVYVHSTYKREITVEGEDRVISRQTRATLTSVSYEPVVNVLSRNGIGFMAITGARLTLLKGIGMYAEIRWLLEGGPSKLDGTDSVPKTLYANDSPGARLLELVAPRSVPRALQTDANRDGAIRTGGLLTGFNARFFFGLNYTLDFGKSAQTRDS